MRRTDLQSQHARPRDAPPDYRQHLEVETPEHVVLDLEIAGIGSRALAAVLDMAILVGVARRAGSSRNPRGLRRAGPAWRAAHDGRVRGWNGYFILFEGLGRGQTPGKRIVGIRVVMDTGHAVTMGAAAARNLLRVADFLPPPYLIGLLLVAFHPRGKRLGDLAPAPSWSARPGPPTRFSPGDPTPNPPRRACR